MCAKGLDHLSLIPYDTLRKRAAHMTGARTCKGDHKEKTPPFRGGASSLTPRISFWGFSIFNLFVKLNYLTIR